MLTSQDQFVIDYGVTPGYLNIRDLSVASGAPFAQQDVCSVNNVALLSPTVVANLFGDSQPVDEAIRIKNVPFTLVGVLERKGESPRGQDRTMLLFAYLFCEA